MRVKAGYVFGWVKNLRNELRVFEELYENGREFTDGLEELFKTDYGQIYALHMLFVSSVHYYESEEKAYNYVSLVYKEYRKLYEKVYPEGK